MEHNSIDEVFQRKHEIKEVFNSSKLYLRAVKAVGYTEIGIIVLHGNKEVARYASHNNDLGEITDITNYFTKPNITVSADEQTLLEIIEKKDWMQKHPVRAFLKYCHRFKAPSNLTRHARSMLYTNQ